MGAGAHVRQRLVLSQVVPCFVDDCCKERRALVDETFARELCALNNRFYAQQAVSFSSTRHAPWAGWRRCLDEAAADAVDAADATSGSAPDALASGVLDVGCGNLRFERFLAARYPDAPLKVRALDSCAALAHPAEGLEPPAEPAGEAVSVQFEECDVMDRVASADAAELARRLRGGVGPFGLSVAFGFFHHVPLPAWRKRLAQAMVRATRPGGYVCLSLWRFMDDEGLAAKACVSHARALRTLGWSADAFTPGDYLLGWRDEEAAFRFCHSFTDEEAEALAASVEGEARLVARFRADGRTGALNDYLVLRAR